MAVGLQPQAAEQRNFVIRILEGRTTTNSPPASYAGAGVDVGAILDARLGGKAWPASCTYMVYTTAGSGVVTATVKLWGGHPDIVAGGLYMAAFPGAGVAAGVLNGGTAVDEHAADIIHRAGTITLPGVFRKYYAEIQAIGGTSTAVNVDLVFSDIGS